MPGQVVSRTLEGKMESALVARAPRSSSLWGGTTAAAIDLFVFQIDNSTIDNAAETMALAASRGERQRIVFINAHVINVAAGDPAYARVIDGAHRRFADGSGMALAGRMNGQRLADNVNGTDLCPHGADSRLTNISAPL